MGSCNSTSTKPALPRNQKRTAVPKTVLNKQYLYEKGITPRTTKAAAEAPPASSPPIATTKPAERPADIPILITTPVGESLSATAKTETVTPRTNRRRPAFLSEPTAAPETRVGRVRHDLPSLIVVHDEGEMKSDAATFASEAVRSDIPPSLLAVDDENSSLERSGIIALAEDFGTESPLEHSILAHYIKHALDNLPHCESKIVIEDTETTFSELPFPGDGTTWL
eukprot:Sspe_Gene.107277::Locus_85383_Transcript_1_1_Confidence_1.000_Length_759::g.107277::m.107277